MLETEDGRNFARIRRKNEDGIKAGRREDILYKA